MMKNASPLCYFERYRWYLQALSTKKAEYAKISADINSGIVSRDAMDGDWQRKLRREIRSLKRAMSGIEFAISSVPETADLLPCKLFLHLYYVVGLSLTETAARMNVSESTVRRIRDRAARYFEDVPLDLPLKKDETSV